MASAGWICGLEWLMPLPKPEVAVARPWFSMRCMLSVCLRCSNVRLVSVFCLPSVSLRMILFL